jgi:peptidoglycan/LPS O-acetylase OafA/YrhL
VPSPDVSAPVTASRATSAHGAPGDGAHLTFRPDVEGLRAIAIAAVVAYHVGLPFARGGFVGVDVFFVISGFLITGLLVREVTSTAHVSLSRFWARRARRLLPAATLVLAVVAFASYVVIPAIDHQSVGIDISASALYVSNMRFAAQATDYLASDAAPSPVLHFWSLGVEEQFYVLWPLLILALAWFGVRRARARGLRVHRGQLAIALALLGIASFGLSLWLTRAVEPWAFFSMPTRAWEFAVGGLVSIGAVELSRLSGPLRRAVGLVGAVLLLGSVVLLTSDVPYPGTAALWPVLGTAALIVAGTTPRDRTVGVARALSVGPMRWLGRLSYSWYLWHWPALVLTTAAVGALATPVMLVVALLALVPAYAAYRWIERPLHHSPALVASTRRSLVLGGALSAAAAVCGLVLASLPGGGALASASTGAAAGDDQTGRGPAALVTTSPTTRPSTSPSAHASPTATTVSWPSGPLTPSPSSIRGDLPVIYSDGCHLQGRATTWSTCAFGDTSSSTSVVLFGDSHAAQWFPALEALAKKHSWKLLVRTHAGCPAPDVTIFQRSLKRAYDECDTWRTAVLAEIARTRPSLVVATGTRTDSLVDRSTGSRIDESKAAGEWQAGWQRTLSSLAKAGVPVAVLRDTPWPGRDMATCVSTHTSNPSACDLATSALDSPAYDVGTVKGFANAHGVDLSAIICDPDRCPATRGKYVVYRDDSHLTATFARELAPYLYAKLAPLLPR